jgi:hypothetical protein
MEDDGILNRKVREMLWSKALGKEPHCKHVELPMVAGPPVRVWKFGTEEKERGHF